MIKTISLAAALLAFVIAGPAAADELTDAAQGLCDSVRSCALEEMAAQELTPEMKSMMEPMLNSMCAAMQEQVKDVPVGHGLYKWAVGCMRSMQSLSCEELKRADTITTPECEEYAKLAREAGVDGAPGGSK